MQCLPPRPSLARCTYLRYRKYRVGKVHGDVSESCIRARERERERETGARANTGVVGTRGRRGSKRLRCFQNILLRFLRLAPAVGPLKGRIRVHRLPPPPFISLSSGPRPPVPLSSLSRVPSYSPLSEYSVIPSSLLLSRISLLRIFP